jgi:hypothetical protein
MVIAASAGPAPAAHPREELFAEPVELADVPEGEGAQESTDCGRGHYPVAEHPAGGATAQQVGSVDAVPTRDHQVDQGQQLAARPGRTGPVSQVDQLVGGLFDAQPLGRRGSQQHTRIGDRVGVVEADVEPVQGVGGSHRERALLVWEHGSSGGRHSPRSEGLSHNRISAIALLQR